MSTVVEGLDWTRMTEDMNELGCALTSPILTPEQCAEFVSMFEDFSAKALMRHGVSVVRSGHRHTLALVLHDAA